MRDAANADPATRCWRCGRTLVEEQERNPGRRVTWHAGHVVDGDPYSPLAPEHSTCNQSAGAARGNRQRARAWRDALLGPLGVDRDVTLVVGPPGAGKSTYAASLGVTHLEREMFPSDRAFRAEVARVARADGARCAVVRTCVWPRQVAQWVELCGATQVVVLDPGMAECVRRVVARRRPGWRDEVAAVRRWYAERRTAAETTATLNPSRRWY